MSGTNNIDDEWSNFLTNKYDSSDDEMDDFALDDESVTDKSSTSFVPINSVAPEPTQIYISTKSKIAFLTEPVDLNIFWDIPIITYTTPVNGVIKKQIKLDSKTPEDLARIKDQLKNISYYKEQVKIHINNLENQNSTSRIKFKDVRKISIGISKKDIESHRLKEKEAFLNCFVLRIRLRMDGVFKEFHVKVFNTGKIEVPGVQSEEKLNIVLDYTVELLQPFYKNKLCYYKNSDTVLINSNFKCGFYIDRERLYDILRTKYNIEAIYDPCSYPGIQCTFYYDHNCQDQTGVNKFGLKKSKQLKLANKLNQANKLKNELEGTNIKTHDINVTIMSFMVFRTGSVLIVGSCEEHVIHDIYKFIVNVFKTEFQHIAHRLMPDEELNKKKKKPRRKYLTILTGVPEEKEVNEKPNDPTDTSNAEITQCLDATTNAESEEHIREVMDNFNNKLKGKPKTRKPRQRKNKTLSSDTVIEEEI